MMRPETIIQRTRQAGIDLSVRDGRIAFQPKSRMPLKLLEQIRAEKDGVTVLLSFIQLVRHIGTDSQVNLEDSEILAELCADGIEELKTAKPEARIAWATAIGLRLIRQRGTVPMDWDKIAYCKHCGPIYSYHNLITLSCDWCEMRVAGKPFPQPEKEK